MLKADIFTLNFASWGLSAYKQFSASSVTKFLCFRDVPSVCEGISCSLSMSCLQHIQYYSGISQSSKLNKMAEIFVNQYSAYSCRLFIVIQPFSSHTEIMQLGREQMPFPIPSFHSLTLETHEKQVWTCFDTAVQKFKLLI